MAVAAELLGVDDQTLRRLGQAIRHDSARTSGNQRRYSRNDLAALAQASHLADQGHSAASLGRILELEQELRRLTADRD